MKNKLVIEVYPLVGSSDVVNLLGTAVEQWVRNKFGAYMVAKTNPRIDTFWERVDEE